MKGICTFNISFSFVIIFLHKGVMPHLSPFFNMSKGIFSCLLLASLLQFSSEVTGWQVCSGFFGCKGMSCCVCSSPNSHTATQLFTNIKIYIYSIMNIAITGHMMHALCYNFLLLKDPTLSF